MSQADEFPDLTPDPDPVPLAVIAKARNPWRERQRCGTITACFAFPGLLAVSVLAVPPSRISRESLVVVAVCALVLGFVSLLALEVRSARHPMSKLTASRRATQQRLSRTYSERNVRNTRIAMALGVVFVWWLWPPLVVALMGFLVGALIVALIVRLTFRRLFGECVQDYSVFRYYTRHPDDPMFTAPLTPADYAAAPPEPWDRPALRHPVEAEWSTLPVQPPAGTYVDRVSSLRPVFMTATIAAFLLLGFAARPGTPPGVVAALAVVAVAILAVVIGSYLYLRTRRNRQSLQEVRLGYSTAGLATVSQDYEERHSLD